MRFIRKNQNFLLILIGILLFLLIYHVGSKSTIFLEYVRINQEIFKQYIAAHYIQAVGVYMALYVSIVFCMIPVTMVLNIAGGYFFGALAGTLYSVISALMGTLASIITIRCFLAQWLQNKYSFFLKSFNENFKKNGIRYLLSLQLFPITPFPVIIICTALSGISLYTFCWTAFVGMFPATFLYALAGSRLILIHYDDRILSWNMIGLLAFLSLLTVLPILMRYFKNSKL